MKKTISLIICTLILSMVWTVPAKADLVPGRLDTGFDPGLGTNDTVLDVALQVDGRILIVGEFTTVDGTETHRVARLNADGTLDTSFDPYVGANNRVRAVIVQPDGKILIGGSFTEINSVVSNRIARLNPNGSVDTSFNPGSGLDSAVRVVKLQPDGKILLGGDFSIVNGYNRTAIARLNADGSLDTGFNTEISGSVYDVEYLNSGKFLIVGSFSIVDGASRNRIARLNADGSLDTSFDPGIYGVNNLVNAVSKQDDGKLLIAGSFTKVDNIDRIRVARMNEDGSLDNSFDPGTGADAIVNDIEVLANGDVYIGGAFSTFNGQARNRLARLENDGSLDPTYNPGVNGVSSLLVWALAFQHDDKLLIGGDFDSVGSVGCNNIARINQDGFPDTAFGPAIAPNMMVHTVVRQPDGKVLIGGYFTQINGVSRNRIARLNSNGSLDTTFNPGTGADKPVFAISLQSDGKILIGGNFDSVDGTTRYHIARLNADGSLDTSFDAGMDEEVYTLAVQPDGKIIAGGAFTTVNGWVHNRIVRLNYDGSRDTTFTASVDIRFVYTSALQSDGKILIAGDFTEINDVLRSRVGRLNTDGTLDKSFKPGTGANLLVRSLEIVSSTGQVMIAGDFTTYNGVDRDRVARLNADGSLDASFDTSLGPNSWVQSVFVQPNGKVIVGGDFTQVGTISRNYIAKLNTDGSLDTSFSPSTNINGSVYSIKGQPDGKILVGGNNIERINRMNAADPPMLTSSLPPSTAQVSIDYSHTFTALGHPAVSLFQVIDGKLPEGLLLDPVSGVLSGKPNETGENNLTIAACNYTSPCDTQTFTITVNESPKIISANSTIFTVGIMGNFTISTDGYPIPEISYTGSLPDGVTFVDMGDGTALLSGTPGPVSAGEYILEINVDNGVIPGAIQTFTLTVNKAFEDTSIFLPLILW